MPQIRVEKTRDFTIVANCHLRDKRLTLKAKGLMTLMLSLPDEWDYSIKGLTLLSNDGKSATAAALRELETCGYLVREQNNENGCFGSSDYTLYEEPHEPKTEPVEDTEKTPLSEFPSSENPSTENRFTVPPTPPVKEYYINQTLNNKTLESAGRAPAPTHAREEEAVSPAPQDADQTPKRTRFVKPSLEEVRAYIAERGSSVDAQAWYDHYESNGWLVGKAPMKDWKAAVRTWERNWISRASPAKKQPESYLTTDEWDEFFDNACKASMGDGYEKIPLNKNKKSKTGG